MHTPKAQPNLDAIRQALEQLDAEETDDRAKALPALGTLEQQIAQHEQMAANLRQQLQRDAYAFDMRVSRREGARQALRGLLPAEPETVTQAAAEQPQ